MKVKITKEQMQSSIENLTKEIQQKLNSKATLEHDIKQMSKQVEALDDEVISLSTRLDTYQLFLNNSEEEEQEQDEEKLSLPKKSEGDGQEADAEEIKLQSAEPEEKSQEKQTNKKERIK